jgi:hypothetical protein
MRNHHWFDGICGSGSKHTYLWCDQSRSQEQGEKLVAELHGSGIRIIIVSPGSVNTESLRAAFGENAKEELAFLLQKARRGALYRYTADDVLLF